MEGKKNKPARLFLSSPKGRGKSDPSSLSGCVCSEHLSFGLFSPPRMGGSKPQPLSSDRESQGRRRVPLSDTHQNSQPMTLGQYLLSTFSVFPPVAEGKDDASETWFRILSPRTLQVIWRLHSFIHSFIHQTFVSVVSIIALPTPCTFPGSEEALNEYLWDAQMREEMRNCRRPLMKGTGTCLY